MLVHFGVHSSSNTRIHSVVAVFFASYFTLLYLVYLCAMYESFDFISVLFRSFFSENSFIRTLPTLNSYYSQWEHYVCAWPTFVCVYIYAKHISQLCNRLFLFFFLENIIYLFRFRMRGGILCPEWLFTIMSMLSTNNLCENFVKFRVVREW